MAEHAPHEHHQQDHHAHHSHHIDEADWQTMIDHIELQGEVLLSFVTDTARWADELRGPGAPPVRRIIDIGPGPGVGTCELASLFPDAQVIAIDSSSGMLTRTAERAAELGVGDRVSTRLGELPAGLDDLEPADVIWASMSLHHIGDEVHALRLLRDLLAPAGVIAIAEIADPTRVLPDDLDLGRPGLADRLDAAGAAWFGGMRSGLPGAVPSLDLASMAMAAGLEVVGSRVARVDLAAPLADNARQMAAGHLSRVRQQFGSLLDADDLLTLDTLLDADDPRSITLRPDACVKASQRILIARAAASGTH